MSPSPRKRARRITESQYVTMRDLLKATGLRRETLHYYLRKGVLPPPVKKGRTSALYDPATVEIVKLVREFQRERRLSLDEIAVLFREKHFDASALRRQLATRDTAVPSSLFLGLVDVIARLSPPPPAEWLDDVVQMRLVDLRYVDGQMAIEAERLPLLQAVWDGTQQGMPLAEFQRLRQATTSEARREIVALQATARDLHITGEAYPRVNELFEAFERYGRLQRRFALEREFLRSFQASASRVLGRNRGLVFPSETFYVKAGLTREIDQLVRDTHEYPHDPLLLTELARACSVRGDWIRLHGVALELLDIQPDNLVAVSQLAQALTNSGRYAECIALIERATRSASHPLLKLRLAQALVDRALDDRSIPGLLQALDTKTRLCAEALEEAKTVPALYRKLRVLVLLDETLTSDPVGLEGPSLRDLSNLRRELEAIELRHLSVVSRVSLLAARLLVLLCLYLVSRRRGVSEADRLGRELQEVDPDGLLAAKSRRWEDDLLPSRATEGEAAGSVR